MNFSEKILFLLMSLALIMTLCFLAFVLRDLNDLWAESQKLWEMFADYSKLIKDQNDKIRDLQILVISKSGVGI
tara:strand:- start:568 stop:789 length:222 start_codon:yes stop_codon:yes gene_type:complete